MRLEAIDLFCGAGGLSYGLQNAGIEIKAGLDFDKKCAFPFTANMPSAVFIARDLAETPASDLQSFYSKNSVTLLAGCAPCQPFSTLRNGTNRQSSKKWPLLNEFSRVVSELAPEVVTMENVPVLKGQSIFADFVHNLERLAYHVTYRIVDAAEYGVAQRRKRLVLLASRRGPIRLLSPQELGVTGTTVREAIGHLEPIAAGECSPKDPMHKARSFTELNLERIKASKPGGTWEDWPEELQLACHKKSTGSTFKSVYGRLEWDKPSSTMTTQSHNFGTGRFGHPEQDRAVSLREMAILQSFPPEYRFIADGEEPNFTSMGRLIGNAVPVKLGYAIGRSIVHHLTCDSQGSGNVQ